MRLDVPFSTKLPLSYCAYHVSWFTFQFIFLITWSLLCCIPSFMPPLWYRATLVLSCCNHFHLLYLSLSRWIWLFYADKTRRSWYHVNLEGYDSNGHVRKVSIVLLGFMAVVESWEIMLFTTTQFRCSDDIGH